MTGGDMVVGLRWLAGLVVVCGQIMAIVVLPADANDYKYNVRECMNQNIVNLQRGVITYPCPRENGFQFVDFLPALGWVLGGGIAGFLLLVLSYILDVFSVIDRKFLVGEKSTPEV